MKNTAFNILYVVSSLNKGGAEQQLYYLLKYLRPNATVVSLGGTGYWEDPLKELGLQVISLQRRSSADFVRLFELVKIIRAGNFDIVHLFIDNVAGIYAHFAAYLTGHPRFVTGERTSIYVHPIWYRAFKRVANRNVQYIICNSQASRDALLAMKLANPTKVKFIPNGIELDRYAVKTTETEVITIGAVGRLQTVKNPILFMRAAAKVIAQQPSVRFVHIGTGELWDEVHQLAKELELEQHFFFYGLRNDIPELLREMDIFALSSNAEGMPNALMEAMATGLPAVVTDVGNCRELITHGENGFVVPPLDVDSFAEALLTLIRDKALRQRMGQRSYERIQAYDVHRMADQYAAVYDAIMHSASR